LTNEIFFQALSHLAKFADIFPFAEPQLLLWQGEFEALSGSIQRHFFLQLI
jgi:hypothetical protein